MMPCRMSELVTMVPELVTMNVGISGNGGVIRTMEAFLGFLHLYRTVGPRSTLPLATNPFLPSSQHLELYHKGDTLAPLVEKAASRRTIGRANTIGAT